MKAFHLKKVQLIAPPYNSVCGEMMFIMKSRSVTFSNGARGFIFGDEVLAPFHQQTSCIVTKDDKDIVLTYIRTDDWGVSHFLMPFNIALEPLSFRSRPIYAETFLFQVFSGVTLCYRYPVQNRKGRYGMDSPDQFCPVFDRFAHLIGISTGLFNEKPICVPILQMI